MNRSISLRVSLALMSAVGVSCEEASAFLDPLVESQLFRLDPSGAELEFVSTLPDASAFGASIVVLDGQLVAIEPGAPPRVLDGNDWVAIADEETPESFYGPFRSLVVGEGIVCALLFDELACFDALAATWSTEPGQSPEAMTAHNGGVALLSRGEVRYANRPPDSFPSAGLCVDAAFSLDGVLHSACATGLFRLDPVTNSWEPTAANPTLPILEPGVGFELGGRVCTLVPKRGELRCAEVTSGDWLPMPQGPTNIGSWTLLNGRLYVTTDPQYASLVHVFDPADDEWRELARVEYGSNASVTALDESLYVMATVTTQTGGE